MVLYHGRPVSENIIDRRKDPYADMTMEEIILYSDKLIEQGKALRDALNKGYVEPHPRINRPDKQAPVPHPRPNK